MLESKRCVCGSSQSKVVCGAPWRCEKKCGKWKSCKVHKCQAECCEEKGGANTGAHLCLKVCGKALSCGKHSCELFCHLGSCGNCPIYLQGDVTCECGKQALKGPLPCGTKVPECHSKCARKQ